MRNLHKLNKPDILSNKEIQWLADFLADPTNNTNKLRYRHKDIKNQLKLETNDKCIYCECKIGHNTPGDIEHKIPSSKAPNLRFDWNNLSIACTECNRRKNDYYVTGADFIDPYIDNVEAILEHHGPIVLWKVGEVRAEISVKTLNLNSPLRIELIANKLTKMSQLTEILERYNNETDTMLKGLLGKQIQEMASVTSEYSAMVLSILNQKGTPIT
jgi:hypothetical protein